MYIDYNIRVEHLNAKKKFIQFSKKKKIYICIVICKFLETNHDYS